MEAACVSRKTYKLQMFVKQPMGPAVQKKKQSIDIEIHVGPQVPFTPQQDPYYD